MSMLVIRIRDRGIEEMGERKRYRLGWGEWIVFLRMIIKVRYNKWYRVGVERERIRVVIVFT